MFHSQLLRIVIPCMTVLFACAASPTPILAAEHPLDPLAPEELKVAFEVVSDKFVTDADLPHEPLRFPLVALEEPPKAFVLSWKPGDRVPRHAEVHILHAPSNRSWIASVDVLERKVLALSENPPGTQPAVVGAEGEAGEEVIRAYIPWRAAMEARGVDPDLAFLDVWAPGDVTLSSEAAERASFGQSTRLLRYLTFNRGEPLESFDPSWPQNPYDRPVEGVVVTVDMNARKVVDMTDTVMPPISKESGNPTKTFKLRELRVSQPAGSDVQRQNRHVRWHGWDFFVGFQAREGLVIYDVRHEVEGSLRPIAYRMSLSEIYVPYGFGDENWIWRSAFDVGEYNAGTLAQTLEPRRDVPDNAEFLDSVVNSDVWPDAENPEGAVVIPRSVALYERNSGMLWTRTDPTTLSRDTRFGKELVVTWNCWIGNYIYAFEWIFKLDGSIEVRTLLTGTTLNRGTTEMSEASAPKVAVDEQGVLLAAPNHQHFVNFRLDLDVDGPDNHAMEMDVTNLPGTGFKNSFDTTMLHLDTEGARDVDPYKTRHWHIESASKKNRLGKPTSYALDPSSFAVPLSAADFPGLERASFAQHQLWVTKYNEHERFAAGEFPNQAKKADGLGEFVKPAQSLHAEDVVVWYTTGFTHVSRPEDFPVMATEWIGFRLVPRGFFPRNPALEVADQGAN